MLIKKQEQWYEGIISSYNVITGKYSVYFPYDGVTKEASYDDEDMEIIDWWLITDLINIQFIIVLKQCYELNSFIYSIIYTINFPPQYSCLVFFNGKVLNKFKGHY